MGMPPPTMRGGNAISEPVFVGRWIKCSERMPAEAGDYLVRVVNTEVQTEPWWRVATLNKHGGDGRMYWSGHFDFQNGRAITHWLEHFSLADDEFAEFMKMANRCVKMGDEINALRAELEAARAPRASLAEDAAQKILAEIDDARQRHQQILAAGKPAGDFGAGLRLARQIVTKHLAP